VEISGTLQHGPRRPLPSPQLAVQRLLELGLFALFPLVIPLAMAAYFAGTWGHGVMLFDLNTMWTAGRLVAHGHSAYPYYLYPAPAAVLMAPIGALPWTAAVAVWWVISIAALFMTLHLLDVEDWRCYGAVFASSLAMWGLEIGTITPVLTLAAAAAWRYRDRPWGVGFAIAFVVGTKLFLWPLAVWLIATKRYRAAVASVVATIVLTIGCWAVIGFDGFLDYPHIISHVATLVQDSSFSVLALVKAIGITGLGARLITLVVAVAALAFIFRAARGSNGDQRAFAWAIGAALLISPIVWAHYFLLLFVPIAIATRRLSVLWLLPLAYWVLPHTAANGSIVVIVCGLSITFFILAACGEWPVSLRAPRRAVA
jgi:alpha-1,2-mannosyltransferase